MLGKDSSRGSSVGAFQWRKSVALAASHVRVDYTFALIDVFMIAAAYFFGLGVRILDPHVVEEQQFLFTLVKVLPVIIVVHVGCNIALGAYGHVWEHASLAEARQVGIASSIAIVILLGLVAVGRELDIVVPVTTVLVGGLLSLVGMGLIRFRSRLFSYQKHGSANSRILVVGDTRAAATFAREAPELKAGGEVLGFVTESTSNLGAARRLAGHPILGSVDQLQTLIDEHQIDQVVVVGGGPEMTRRVVDRCLDVDVRLRILPGAEDVMMGRSVSLDARDIEIDDLLARPAVSTDLTEVGTLISGKRILITGAGGSIGSEIVRQVLSYEPSQVYALDRDETLLHDAHINWSGPVTRVLADIRDRARVFRIFSDLKPQVVFHAAALKHVPVLEEFPEEAVLTNIIGTLNLIDAGSLAKVERLVLISTDKAVDPASVMGATKRVAEMLVQTGNERNGGCEYTAVRFGNVLGSRGSVVPTFVEQVKRGGPVTVTHPDMTRFFMTADEAVQLVLQAASLAKGSDVFVLDMGEPVRIVDLARRLIRLAGLSPHRDIQIVYTGRRPGEKLSEVLAEYPLRPTRHPSISVAEPPHPGALAVRTAVEALGEAARTGDRAKIRGILTEVTLGLTLVPEALDLRAEDPVATWS